MKYRELLYFIGKCLTLRAHPGRKDEIRQVLGSGRFAWEKLVWVSSRQKVLPALYVQLRDADLLGELPGDLVAHMENIHLVNQKRNRLLLEQVSEVTALLNKNGMHPIFLKGTAHLLQGLYVDVGERMVGDIDFLLPEAQILPAVELLGTLGYSYPIPYASEELSMMKHYPRLRNEKAVAALEIHRQPVSAPYDRHYNLALIQPEIQQLEIVEPRGDAFTGKAHVLSPRHQLIHNIMNAQMNDKGYASGKIFLRQMYDLLLLSRRSDPLTSVSDFAHYPKQLGTNLIVSAHLLDDPDSLTYADNKFTRNYYRRIRFFLGHIKLHKFYRALQYIGNRIKRYILVIFSAIFSKKGRRALVRRLRNRGWYRAHFAGYRKIRNV